ncbi:hypothetical protein SGLAD_v1c01350 [Spiroplasma gladiatoris]|uniref:Uncharacterized protein n=1 Tax=Spiroplasma gladiatoris TaxID=2143 RepID=A0A4P7AG69_9MOLU|nr:hypothetical protein [Spiroplasma gladiatoris]QBQ07334.1 hypothetical protein SGLAD_v1c01350 [Spiroplasma gladiatoris]
MLSTKQSIFSTIVGTFISLFNTIIQLLLIYWILEKYGTQFNGFVRIVSSFSLIISTAESSLGVATTILLVRPLVHNDWITANEIYSTSKKLYRKASVTEISMTAFACFAYPLYAGVSSSGGFFESASWQSISIPLAGIESGQATYFILVFVALAFSCKNFIGNYWFNSYECVMAADSRNTIRRLIILFSDILVYSIMFYLMSLDYIIAFIPFFSLIIYSPIKGLLVSLYVKRKYVWLKYYRDFNSIKLTSISAKISKSSIGTSILINADMIVAALLLGLGVSSTLSLYLVIAVNVRLIMTNFITSFKDFFITLVAQRGRINWESYSKYELYTYLVAAFTFINMAILSPYFVSALYSDLALSNLESQKFVEAENEALNFMFFSPKFSILYAFSTALIILCEGQITLIHAKGRYGEVSKFQNILGGTYLICVFGLVFLAKTLKIGGDNNVLISGIITLYVLKSLFLLIRYCYLWLYVWRYATYNSTFKHVWNNLAILCTGPILMTAFTLLYLDKYFDIKQKSTGQGTPLLPLVSLFFATVFISAIILVLTAYIFSPKTMNGIIKNLPLINRIVNKKVTDARKKRFEENGIDIDKIVDKSDQLGPALYGIVDESAAAELSLETIEIKVEPKNDKIYVLRGKGEEND